MCGIIGIVSKKEFSVRDFLLSGLKRLEYRGYDSWGFATLNGEMFKETGGIYLINDDITTTSAISHTRWATNGGVTRKNAHPHSSQDIYVVHNGIIENADLLRSKLAEEGYDFASETDTETIPHLIHKKIGEGKDMKSVACELMNELEGTFAILIIREHDNRIYALKKDSPLVLGIVFGRFVLSSDVYAFSDVTNQAIFFEDNEFAIVGADEYEFYDSQGKKINKEIVTFEWEVQEQTKDEYEHYMLKEINEEPVTAERLIQSLRTIQYNRLMGFVNELKNSKRVVFVSCGTSYHASLVGAFLLNRLGIRSQAVIASEFENFVDIDSETTVVAISQSGETMDVVVVIKKAAQMGAKVLSIVNVPYSTIQRHSVASLEIMAGQEICVAATKSFTNQLITLFALARQLGYDSFRLSCMPQKIKNTIEKTEENIISLAQELEHKEHIFVLGRGLSYPIAREFALKLKEIPYIHAEGMMGGELKHGTIALIENDTPVISLISNKNSDMISNTKEVQARGAKTIIISNTNDGDINVEESDDAEFSIYSSIVGHLLSYHIAKRKQLPIDKPRNLAKSVTVK